MEVTNNLEVFAGRVRLELNKGRSLSLAPLTLCGMAGISLRSIVWGSNGIGGWLIVFISKAYARLQLSACQLWGY